jgi:hypothetical protein
MANVQNTTAAGARAAKSGTGATSTMSIIAPVAGWLLPGLGHLIQRRWIRGLLLMLAVFIMFFAGLGMQGKVYPFNTGDLLDILGFVGDIGAGLLYFIARAMDMGAGNIQRAVADYGTKFIVVAGLLNIVSAADAYHIAIGKKQ